MVSLAESPARFGHFGENRVEPGGAGDGAKDATDRALLLPDVLEFARDSIGAVLSDVDHFRQLRPSASAGLCQRGNHGIPGPPMNSTCVSL